MEKTTEKPDTYTQAGFAGLVADFVGLLDEAECAAFFRGIFRPDGPVCCACGCELPGQQRLTWLNGGRVHCAACGTWQTWRSGTPLCGLKLTYRQLAAILLLHRLGHPASVIAQVAGCSDDTVRRMARRLLEG